MSSVTALELINRVMGFRRQPAISSFQSTDPEHVVTLNALNMAKESILGTRRWEFDLRHDGQLITRASTDSRSVDVTFTSLGGTNTAGLVLTGLTAGDELVGDWVSRITPTESTTYSSTAFRIISASYGGPGATATLPVNYPDAVNGIEANIFWSEYLLPDTVREVVRASYEQEEVRLDQLSPTTTFDEYFPSLGYDTGEPRVLAVGGFDIPTYTSGDTEPSPKLRAVVWPVPDDEYVLTYSYYYAHPEFTDGDSTLTGVPAWVVNNIVWEALAVMKMAWDGDYTAAHFSDMAQAQATANHVAYGGSKARRHTVRSWDTGRSVFSPDFADGTKLIGDF